MIGFAGLSHLGMVSSVAAAVKGFEVVAYGPEAEHPHAASQVVEPGLEEALAAAQARLHFTQDPGQLGRCGLIFLSLDVETGDGGVSDLCPIEDMLRLVVDASRPGTAVAILSQVPPGTLRRWDIDYGARGLALFYQVETLVIGRALDRALRPERFIVGCAAPEQALPDLYARYLASFGCPVLRLNYESAEISKVAINAFLASSVSTTNMLAELCERVGADWSAITETLRLDRRIGPHAYLAPGLGLSGGNIERDLATLRLLSDRHGTDTRLIDSWLANSRYRRDWVLRQLHQSMTDEAENPVVAVWGLAYKAGTASMKNAPALALIDSLPAHSLRVYDPRARLDQGKYPHITQVASPVEACQGADVLAVMTPWPEFRSCPVAQVKAAMRGRTVIDPFHVMDEGECSLFGLSHYVLGKTPLLKETVA